MASPQGLTPATRTLLFLSVAVVVLAGMHAARGVLAPLFLAAVLVIIVHPLRHPLEQRGWPRAAATTAVVVVVYLILAALVAMLVFAGVRFTSLVDDYMEQLLAQVSDVGTWLASLGFDQSSIDEATSALQPSQLISLAASLGGAVVGILSTLFVVVTYVIFMAADAGRYDSAHTLFGASQANVLGRATTFNVGVRRYFVVSAPFGAIVAVIAVYCVVNVVLQVLVQPKFVADTVNITLTLSFVSVIFWTFIIGPLGAILAVPLTLLTRAVLLQGGPETAWYSWLSGDELPTKPEPDPEPAAG